MQRVSRVWPLKRMYARAVPLWRQGLHVGLGVLAVARDGRARSGRQCRVAVALAAEAQGVRRLRSNTRSARHHSTHLEKETLRMAMKLTKNIGMLLLGIWLILGGLIPLLNLSFSELGTLMAILAIAAGAFILLGR